MALSQRGWHLSNIFKKINQYDLKTNDTANSGISGHQYLILISITIRYASSHYESMSGYESAALDFGPSPLSRCGSNSRKAIDPACEPENNRKYQCAPNGTVHGRTCAEHVSAAQNKRHIGVDQYLTSSVFICHLCSLACSIFNFTLFLQFSLKM